MDHPFCQVALPLPLAQVFDYALPPGMPAQAGCRVAVPFGQRKMVGVVTKLLEKSEVPAPKSVVRLLDAGPFIRPEMLEFTRWLAEYYLAGWGEALSLAAPPWLRLPGGVPTGRSSGAEEAAAGPVLNAAQAEALASVSAALKAGQGGGFLLHGVTGSGKTEVYLRALERTLALGGTAIVLVPEISLTPQTLERFDSRFPGQVAVLHSGLTRKQRGEAYLRLAQGRARVALGARSALFAPLAGVRLIVVDEESEPSYKQENSPRYHARDAALMLGRMLKAVVVLGSATPSFESFHNAELGKLKLLKLPGRVASVGLPTFHFLDLNEAPTSGDFEGLLPGMAEAVRGRLKAGEQTLLFLNRRGFAPVLTCVSCGQAVGCPQCSISLTYHKVRPGQPLDGPGAGLAQPLDRLGAGLDSNGADRGAWLLCHMCGHAQRPPKACPNPTCGKKILKIMGLGTQRLEQEVRKLFPGARVLRVDRDTAGGREFHAEMGARMRAREVDILLGTQMIAKGLDFPDLTLVGVIQADASLSFPDFRAAERTFQLLVQVAGRAGRRDKPGDIWVQTRQAEHPCLQAAARQDFAAFYKEESRERQDLQYPPFSRLAGLLVRARDKDKAFKGATSLAAALQARQKEAGLKGLSLLGPAPAPMVQLKGWWRYRMLVKAADSNSLHRLLDPLVFAFKAPGCRVAADVDPVNFM